GMLETFDAPAMDPNCAARNASTVAPQALMFMNSEFIVAQAGYFAERVRREAGVDRRAQVSRAWSLAFGSEAGDTDLKDALAFLTEQEAHLRKKNGPAASKSDSRQQALASFCQTLLSANQFLYVD